MSRWFRHYAGMMRDDKLVRVAIKSGQTIERVLWVWGAILESAAEIDDNGRYDVDESEIAYFLRADEDHIRAITAALADAGRLDSGAVAKWDNRQFSSDRSAARVAAYRERKRNGERQGNGGKTSPNGDVTLQKRHRNSPETDTELPDTDVSGAEAPVDLAKALFDSAVPYLVAHGSKSANARSMVASWRNEHGNGPVIDAVAAAQREAVSEPIPFIIKVLERRNGKSTGRVQRNDPPAANPLLAAAVRRYGNRDSSDDRLDFGATSPPAGRD